MALNSTDSKPLFSTGAAINARLALAVALSVALMTIDHRYYPLTTPRDLLATAIYPLQHLMSLPGDAVGWAREQFASRQTLLEENARLRERQLLMNAQMQKLTSLEAENRRLRALMESSVALPDRSLVAELISVDFDPYRHQILIDKGHAHGAAIGQPLLDDEGVIGQLIEVNRYSSRAILITDANHALPVQINRNGLRTLAIGTGKLGELELPHIPNNADVRVGDLLISSGLGGRFPRGYPVARITRVAFDPSRPFAQVVAQPTARLDRSREVLLVIEDHLTDDPPATEPGA